MDLYAFTLLLVNALSRPRMDNERLLSLLYGDGMIFFLVSLNVCSLSSALLKSPKDMHLWENYNHTLRMKVTVRSAMHLFSLINAVVAPVSQSNI